MPSSIFVRQRYEHLESIRKYRKEYRQRPEVKKRLNEYYKVYNKIEKEPCLTEDIVFRIQRRIDGKMTTVFEEVWYSRKILQRRNFSVIEK